MFNSTTRRLFALTAGLFFSACASSSSRPSTARVGSGTSVTPDSDAGSVAVAPLPPACETPAPATPGFIVSNAEGIRELALDGTVVRFVSHTPAGPARFLSGRRDVVFVALDPDGSAPRREVRQLNLDTCAERVVVALPVNKAAPCGGIWTPEDAIAQYVQDDADFWISPDQSSACLLLTDRNVNMASAQSLVRVVLSSGQVEQATTIGEGCNPVSLETARTSLSCQRAPIAPVVPPTTTFAFSLGTGGRVMQQPARGRPRATATIAMTDAMTETRSPSGRWDILSGNIESGDVITRDVFLFDRQTGSVFIIQVGAWPAAITAAQLRQADTMHSLALNVAGETPIRWLGAQDGVGSDDVLFIRDLVVFPGVRTIQANGDLAH